MPPEDPLMIPSTQPSILHSPFSPPPDLEFSDPSSLSSTHPLPSTASNVTEAPIVLIPKLTSSSSSSSTKNDPLHNTPDIDIEPVDTSSATDIAPGTAAPATPKKNDTYILSRTYLSSSRLNYQFYLWRETLPFPRLLHPCIPVLASWPSGSPSTTPLPSRPPSYASLTTKRHSYPTPPTTHSPPSLASPPLRIADVATGTAIWPIQLARHLPASASLYGFDISLSQAPPRAWLPSNLTLREWDIFTPVPDDCIGMFDVVHVRLLLLVLKPPDVHAVVRRLGQMLRDGGWLQWEELDLGGSYIQRAGEAGTAEVGPLPTLERMLGVLQHEGEKGWVKGLEDAVRDEGFDDVRVERYWDGLQESRAVFEMHLLKDEEMARGDDLDEAGREATRRRISDMYDESRRGAVLGTPKLVCVARKWGGGVSDGGVVNGDRAVGEPVEWNQVDGDRVEGEQVEECYPESPSGKEEKEEAETIGLGLQAPSLTAHNGDTDIHEHDTSTMTQTHHPTTSQIDLEILKRSEEKRRWVWHDVFPC